MIETGHGWRPGLIGWIVNEHIRYYGREWQFSRHFEATIAAGVGAFFQRYDDVRDRVIWAENDGELVASLVVEGSDPQLEAGMSHLRWFIISDAARGAGLGRRMMDQAMAFIDEADYAQCYLTTFSGLHAARHLYESYGFELTQEGEDTTWGIPILEQRFDWRRT